MKFFLTLALLVIGLAGVAKPKVYFNYHVFFTPESQSYVSTSLQFDSGSLKYYGDSTGNLFAKLEITHIFKQQDSIILADKYLLTSPAMKDSTVEDFYDLRNYALEPGIYSYELVIKDALTGEIVAGEQAIQIQGGEENEIIMSDVAYIQDAYQTDEKNNFTKNGFFMLPYLTNYYPPETNKIVFYLEIYNANKVLEENEDYLISYSIIDRQMRREVDGIFQYQRLKAASVTPIIGFLPIDVLPTGSYDLNITLINKDSDTIFQKLAYFERRSDVPRQMIVDMENVEIGESFMASIPRDSIPYFLQSLMPISPRFEYESIRKILKAKDTTQMEEYFYVFWVTTAPDDPAKAWQDYRKQVYIAEGLFGTQIKYAFETDRGRIYLQYGPPNDLIDRPSEIGTLPYQIWRYYRIDQRSDVRFVFYNPDLVTNDYPLVHSELPGEIQNYNWPILIQDERNISPDEPTNTQLYYGGNSNLYYTNP
ncbi:MAG: GWxTD domain-containing protein [Crocinitomicaceae bacterium]|nr:GWxTD domain-containing protein [Crocinitomicaceae bacterium]